MIFSPLKLVTSKVSETTSLDHYFVSLSSNSQLNIGHIVHKIEALKKRVK